MKLEEVGGGRPVEIVVRSTIPLSLVISNVAASMARGLPRFAETPGLGKAQGPIAIVAGGPSLNAEIENLRKFPGPIIACGTVHDHLIANGIVPRYQVFVDPDPIIATMVSPVLGVTYLPASQCHTDLFDKLAGFDARLWHAFICDPDTGKEVVDFGDEPSVPGGDCVVLRAWPLATVLGHRSLHFFGFDCSFPDDCESQHAYSYDWEREEKCYITIRETGERFATAPGWLSQIEMFMKMLAMSRGQFEITIHGHSLVASMCCKPV